MTAAGSPCVGMSGGTRGGGSAQGGGVERWQAGGYDGMGWRGDWRLFWNIWHLGRWARSGTANGGDAPNGVKAAAWHGVLSPRSLEVLCRVLRQSRGRWHAKGHGRVFILKVMQWPLRSVTMVEHDHQRMYCSCLVLYTESVRGEASE